MKKKFNIFGISGNQTTSFNEKFDTCDVCSDHMFAVSKETFHHIDENSVSFDYKYCIEVCETDCTHMLYILSVVFCKESLKPEYIEKIKDMSGVEYDEINEEDITSYGCDVNINSVVRDSETIEDSVLDEIANTITHIDGFFGFYMDKHVNYEETGWTLIDKFCKK